MIYCNNPETSNEYKVSHIEDINELKIAIDSKTGGDVEVDCHAFIYAVEGIQTGDAVCEQNLTNCLNAKAQLQTDLDSCVSAKNVLQADLNTCVDEKNTLQSTINSLNSQLNTCTADKASIQDDLNDANAQITTLNSQISQLNSDITTLNSTISSLNAQISNIDSKIDLVLGRAEAGDSIAKLDIVLLDKSNIATAIANKKGSDLTNVNDLSTYATEISNLPTGESSEDLQACQDEKAVIQGNLDTCITEKQTAIDNLATCTSEKQTLEDNITTLNSTITQLEADLSTCTTDKQTIQDNLDTCIAEKATLQTSLDNANTTITDLNNQITTLNNQITQLTTDLDTANALLATINSRLDTLAGRAVSDNTIEVIDALDADKLAIKNSIESKTNTTLTDDYSTYSDAIDSITTGEGGGDCIDYGWNRPLDWVPMPTLPNTEGEAGDKFYGLFLVEDSYIEVSAIQFGGAVTIDWGDGNIEDFNSGILAKHKYNFADIDSPLTDKGEKQAIVTVVPQSGQRFTSVKAKAGQTTDFGVKSKGFSEIHISGDAITSFKELGAYNYTLKFVKIVNTPNVNNLEYFMYNAYSLLALDLCPMPLNTNLGRAISGCPALTSVDFGDMPEVTSMLLFANYSYGIERLHVGQTGNVTTMGYGFNGLKALKALELNMLSCTNTGSTINDNHLLQKLTITNCSTDLKLKNCYSLPASELDNLIQTGLVDLTGGTAKTLDLSGTTASANLSTASTDWLDNHNWTLVT